MRSRTPGYWRLLRDTKDEEVIDSGPEKTRRVDLGLALLCAVAKPGVPLDCHDIATWCGCTDAAINLIQRNALKKLRNRLRFGNSRELGGEMHLSTKHNLP